MQFKVCVSMWFALVWWLGTCPILGWGEILLYLLLVMCLPCLHGAYPGYPSGIGLTFDAKHLPDLSHVLGQECISVNTCLALVWI